MVCSKPSSISFSHSVPRAHWVQMMSSPSQVSIIRIYLLFIQKRPPVSCVGANSARLTKNTCIIWVFRCEAPDTDESGVNRCTAGLNWARIRTASGPLKCGVQNARTRVGISVCPTRKCPVPLALFSKTWTRRTRSFSERSSDLSGR